MVAAVILSVIMCVMVAIVMVVKDCLYSTGVLFYDAADLTHTCMSITEFASIALAMGCCRFKQGISPKACFKQVTCAPGHYSFRQPWPLQKGHQDQKK